MALQRLAAQLLACGVKPGDRVAMMRSKNHQTFEAVHAILGVGAIVVPVDPLAPAVMAQAALVDSGATAVVGDSQGVAKLDPWIVTENLRGVFVSDSSDDPRTIAVDVSDGPFHADSLPSVSADDGAYIVYTSGSTGQPKGILHSHRSGLAYAELAAAEHEMGPHDRLAAMCPAHFDMSTLEFYAAPLVGASIVQFSEAHLRFPASFTERAFAHETTMFYAVPTLLASIVERGVLSDRDTSSLTKVVYAGEPYEPELLSQLMKAFPEAKISNAYGPAEVNVCTVHHFDGAPDPERGAPIGKPWPGSEVLVVADDETPIEPGLNTKGELWVSAITRMSHYWNKPELSAAKSRPNPGGLSDWYTTGDIVSQDSDGLLWLWGRRDHQVKIRGVRLELEAIESVLGRAPGVLFAVAGTRKVGDHAQIVAAVVPRDGFDIDERAVRRFCQAALHPAGVPQSLLVTTSFPQTPSGKIDRGAVRRDLAAESSNA